MGDSTKLAHVFIDFLDNAVKFSSAGEIHISSKILETQDKYICLEFSVKDNGIGIPEDKIKNLFEAFYRVDNSRTRTQSGAGLGLAICKHYIELMGGEISVESDIGKGSTFRFNVKLNHPK